jgi:hypothetical protein
MPSTRPVAADLRAVRRDTYFARNLYASHSSEKSVRESNDEAATGCAYLLSLIPSGISGGGSLILLWLLP